ncbi:hypothetical protein [Macrococcoides caseolyticum]|uniref:hypothetical protein n=2 Tax=Macrococcoides caseolyticum TaxID=69966 RepID=UPI000C32BE05|nr:hypothetical protein [Macrococcus caseolyticus]PKE18911.1 hypothetical protein CW679_08200 [Macrococcus caseolyticus]PKF40291.1 hypothetical protein CW661_08605 [Macrococcus caseolyticus]QYA35312.1 hypothetical protein KYI08_11990 [Macrococcus caseolyticus]
MRNNSWLITVIFIVLTLLVFGFGGAFKFVNSPPGSLDGYILIVSFMGLFATFGGAYMGAKVSGEYSLKAVKEQFELQRKDDNRKAELKKNIVFDKAILSINNTNLSHVIVTINLIKHLGNHIIFTTNQIEYLKDSQILLDDLMNDLSFYYLSSKSKKEVQELYELLGKIISSYDNLQKLINLPSETNEKDNKHISNSLDYLKIKLEALDKIINRIMKSDV